MLGGSHAWQVGTPTTNISARNGNFLQGKYLSYCIPNIPVTIFDTPGLADADVPSSLADSLGAHIDSDLHAFVILVKDDIDDDDMRKYIWKKFLARNF